MLLGLGNTKKHVWNGWMPLFEKNGLVKDTLTTKHTQLNTLES